MQTKRDIVIIGAGPAGVSAAVQCQRLGRSPLLLDRDGRAGGLALDAFSIENYPGIPPTTGESFARLLEAHLRRFKVGITEGEVRRVERTGEGFLVHLSRESLFSRAVIVAVGTSPRTLEISGAEHLLYSPRPAIAEGCEEVFVVGGGEAALDYALSLAAHRIEAKILLRGDDLRARGRLVDLVSRSPFIEIWRNTRVLEIQRLTTALQVSISRKAAAWEERIDAVIAAVGREPRVGPLLKGLDVGPDKTVSSRIPGLFLAGDVRCGTTGQAGMAVGDGLAAGMAAIEMLEVKAAE